ncbi:AAA family ATPase [Microseira wollei]|uniref:Endonuclease GajA/Old nuclease/RecF-like AAA domain-containing protein n=1 Tax=Microseira wollei NIES-4236 TaxID=2530354 RepID=A0AAV3XKB4_9CYAN|nr:AAA family ATPase [Microseira wollei]GET42028.1 hypothetical protein MiSe_68420 [Microseira wollei NIES-4236]
MHLLRIQVPDFRGLKDIDITFEKEFNPRIFPLGSQNGGGKSTLLQLIFVLLHCSRDPERKIFLENLLWGFKITADKSDKKVLATIEIWHQNQSFKIEFFAYRDLYLRELLNCSEQKINDDEDIRFSASIELEEVRNKILNLEKGVSDLENSLDRLKEIKRIENYDDRLMNIIEESRYILESGLTIYSNKLDSSMLKNFPSFEDVQEDVQTTLNFYKLHLKTLYEKSKQIETTSQKALKYMQSNNLIYICNYSSNKKEKESALICNIDNLNITEAETFLKELSQKVFMAAPPTQVFLFLSQEQRKQLFTQHSNNYYFSIKAAKSKLPGFFTYDFLPIELLIKVFIGARDQDFQEAIETGEYGNSYKALKNELNKMLVNKKINIDKDLSGVTFRLDKNGEDIELYPEDLSHGELKRLSIYMWLKYRNIKDAIVLIDELEIALHPDWQYQIISDLIEWASSNQYILATHSYELCQAVTPAHVKEIEPKLIKKEA